MKISTLVVFLVLIGLSPVEAREVVSPFNANNILLKSFQAIKAGNGAKILWEFTSEERDVTCNLEKSSDGVNFISFRTIVLHSTREQAVHSYVDREAKGTTFYRLRITKDAHMPFVSQIVSLAVASNSSVPLQFPVSAFEPASLLGAVIQQEEKFSVKLVDFNGQIKINQESTGNELNRNFKPHFSRLPAGYYVLRVNDMQNRQLMSKMIYKL